MVADMDPTLAKLKGALTDRGWSQRRLARVLGVSPSAMSRLLAGQRKLTAGELAALADALGIPIGFFTGDAGTATRPLALAARLGASSLSSQLRPQLDRVRALLELRALLDRLVSASPATARVRVERPQHPDPIRAGHELAAAVRASLGLGDTPVGDMAALVTQNFGVDIAIEPLDENVVGMLVTDPDVEDEPLAVMLVNSDGVLGRQRFTIAHELAHLLFRDQELVVADVEHSKSSPTEKRAHAFASAFLAPEGGVQAIVDGLAPRPPARDTAARIKWIAQLVTTIAATFGMSLEAASIRACGLGHLSAKEQRTLMDRSIGDIVEAAGQNERLEEFQQRRNVVEPPIDLRDRALFAYQNQLIGIGPLAELWHANDPELLRGALAEQGWAPYSG